MAAGAQATPHEPALSRARRFAVWTLVVVAALCVAIAVLGGWVREVALNDSVWADNSETLLQSPNVRNVVAGYVTDGIFTRGDATARLQRRLPPNLDPLAAPIAGALRSAAERTTEEALTRPRVQALWRAANVRAHAQFVGLIEDKTTRVKISGNNAVVLDVGAIGTNVASRLGLSQGVGAKLPSIQPIVLLRADQLSTVQTAVRVLRDVSFWLFGAALIAWAGAIWLARGRRREVVRGASFSLVVVALVLLAARRLGGNAIVDSLADSPAVRPAAADVWAIYTALLRDVSVALLVIGLAGALWAWASGPGRRAVALRRRAAPVFRERPVLVHGGLALIVLLLLAWGPLRQNTRLATVAILVALAFTALEVLRRQTVREFADGVPGPAAVVVDPAGAAAEIDAPEARLARLERLADLHDRGALTDEEYRSAKESLGTA
jgi:hypothetical protein